MEDLVTSRREINPKLPAQRYIKMQSERDLRAQDNEIKARHNAKSLFLQLPLELKTLIYELVCGGQVIHIKSKRNGLAHTLCSAEPSEEEAQTMFDISDADYNAPNTNDRHGTCWALNGPPRSWGESVKFSVLSCCRQMYLELTPVLYYTNTFSFNSAIELSQFCLKTPRQSLDIIRSVHVDVGICINEHYLPGTWEWEKGFETITSSLKGLKRLHVNVEFYDALIELDISYGLPARELLLKNILQAGKLDLEAATVILWDADGTYDSSSRDDWPLFSPTWYGMEPWTLAQKQEWSRYVRRALLHYEDQASDLASVKRKALEEGRICRL